jgi:hypothetical protein
MKKKYSYLQYFFWLVSGSEISILKECKTDYNRYANIGLTIFATSLIAFFTGSIAGYYFQEETINKYIFLFGILWSCLVFTIDRNMVLTLQKNPQKKQRLFVFDDKTQNLLSPVLYRVLLSIAIAFFISIPLELVLFKDLIVKQMADDLVADTRIYKNKLENRENTSYYNILVDSIKKETNQNNSKFNKEPETQIYRDLKEKYEDESKKQNSYQNDYNEKESSAINAYMKIPVIYDSILGSVINKNSNEYLVYKQIKNISNDALILLNKQVLVCGKIKYGIDSIKGSYYNELYKKKQILQHKDSVVNDTINRKLAKIILQTNQYQNNLSGLRGFIKQWIALNNIKDFWVKFFIWFIRIFFFIVEMLPTIAKLSTPIGDYDEAYFTFQENLKSTKKGEREKQYFDNLEEKIKRIIRINVWEALDAFILNVLNEKLNKFKVERGVLKDDFLKRLKTYMINFFNSFIAENTDEQLKEQGDEECDKKPQTEEKKVELKGSLYDELQAEMIFLIVLCVTIFVLNLMTDDHIVLLAYLSIFVSLAAIFIQGVKFYKMKRQILESITEKNDQ